MAHVATDALKRLVPALVLGGLLGVGASAQETSGALHWAQSLHLSASAGFSSTNNASRTSYEPTRKDANSTDLSLSGSIPRQLAPGWLLVASAGIDAHLVQEYTLADDTTGRARLSLQRKFGLGPQGPVLSFNVSANYKSARLGYDRGTGTEAGVELAKRVLPNLRVAASAQWLEHNARLSTFDLNQHSYSINAQWDLDDHWTLSGSASRLQGDIVANAAWSVWAQAISGVFGPTVSNYYNARPWKVTDIWGSGWVSYNVEADVDLWSVAATYAFTDHTSLELRRSAAYVVNKIGVAYPTDTWSLSVTHRF